MLSTPVPSLCFPNNDNSSDGAESSFPSRWAGSCAEGWAGVISLDPETTLQGKTLRVSAAAEGPEAGRGEVTAKVTQLTQNFSPGPSEAELTTIHTAAPEGSGPMFLLGKVGLEGQARHPGTWQRAAWLDIAEGVTAHVAFIWESWSSERAGWPLCPPTLPPQMPFPPWKHPTRPGGSGSLGSGQTMPGEHISVESQARGSHTQPSLPPI